MHVHVQTDHCLGVFFYFLLESFVEFHHPLAILTEASHFQLELILLDGESIYL